MTRPSAPTKADLLEMLAEAVRNTQPQPVNTQSEPVRDAQPEPKRKTRPRNTRPAKRTVKNKSVRASTSRKQRRR
jgi:hypothetical protein